MSAAALRPMRWWDIEPVHALETRLFPRDPWSVELFWSELAAAGRHYLVAESGGAVVGYAGAAVTPPDADVQTVAVSPTAQGQGLGRVLLDALLQHAAAAGASSVMLEVRADNAPALAMYRAAGFDQIGVRRRYYQPDDVDALVMRLRPIRPAEPATPRV